MIVRKKGRMTQGEVTCIREGACGSVPKSEEELIFLFKENFLLSEPFNEGIKATQEILIKESAEAVLNA